MNICLLIMTYKFGFLARHMPVIICLKLTKWCFIIIYIHGGSDKKADRLCQQRSSLNPFLGKLTP